jgi:hypothetical protein
VQHRRRLPFLLAGLVLAMLAACDGYDITDPDDVSFTTVYHSQVSGIDDSRQQLVESQGEWNSLWSEIGQGGPPPSVDFGRDMVAVVAAGERPNGCHTIEIRDIDIRSGLLRIDARRTEPGEGCVCTPAIVHPVHAVRLRRTSRGVDFDVDRVVQTCR